MTDKDTTTSTSTESSRTSPTKRKAGDSMNQTIGSMNLLLHDSVSSKRVRLIRDVRSGALTEALLATNLNNAVMKFEDDATNMASGLGDSSSNAGAIAGAGAGAGGVAGRGTNTPKSYPTTRTPMPVYFVPRKKIEIEKPSEANISWIDSDTMRMSSDRDGRKTMKEDRSSVWIPIAQQQQQLSSTSGTSLVLDTLLSPNNSQQQSQNSTVATFKIAAMVYI